MGTLVSSIGNPFSSTCALIQAAQMLACTVV